MDNQEQFDLAMEEHRSSDYEFIEDVKRICKVAYSKLNIDMTLSHASFVWTNYSESMSASWMHIDSDEHIEREIRQFMGLA